MHVLLIFFVEEGCIARWYGVSTPTLNDDVRNNTGENVYIREEHFITDNMLTCVSIPVPGVLLLGFLRSGDF